MTSLPVFTLTEWQTMLLPDLALSAEDRRLVANLQERDTGRLDVTELRQGIQIKAYSWVGLIRFHNFEVRVRPKLAGGNVGLVEMLGLTSGLSALRRNQGHRQLDIEESIHLLDLIALLFAEACQRIVAGGLLHDYVEQESDLPVLRGRLLVGPQVRQFYGRVDRLACRYDDHLTDVIENQILAVALTACRSRVSHPGVRLQIHRLHTIFAAACTAEALTDLKSARLRMYYHRQNEHYREAHELAWLLLDSMGINDLLAVGHTRGFAFLLDMNQLFELFITRLVRHALQHRAYRIHPQKRDRSLIWDLMHKRPYTHVTPDILIETKAGRYLTVDAKYKLYDEKRLSTADIYQSFFYAYAYNDSANKTPAALLLYPSSGQRERQGYLQIRAQDWAVKAQLRALSISIPQAITEIRENTFGSISQALLEVIDELFEAGEV